MENDPLLSNVNHSSSDNVKNPDIIKTKRNDVMLIFVYYVVLFIIFGLYLMNKYSIPIQDYETINVVVEAILIIYIISSEFNKYICDNMRINKTDIDNFPIINTKILSEKNYIDLNYYVLKFFQMYF